MCVVEDVFHINRFETEQEFVDFCKPYSVFTPGELKAFYVKRTYPWVIQFTYNFALSKRPNRASLLNDVGLPAEAYWGFFQVSTKDFKTILKLSGDYEKARSLVYTS